MKIAILVLCLILGCFAAAPSLMCSSFCFSCITIAANTCLLCRQPFTNVSGTTCGLDSSSQYSFVDASTDVSQGTLTLTSQTGSESCGAVQYFGNSDISTPIVFTSNLGVSVPHFELRVIASLIIIDAFSTLGETIDVTLNTETQQYSLDFSLLLGFQCSSGELSIVLDVNFTHAQTGAPLTIQIGPGSHVGQQNFGVKEVLLLARKCHANCGSCTGNLQTQCLSCQNQLRLSGGTCAQGCLDSYGIPPNASRVCIACQSSCKTCAFVSSNCTACWPSGNDEGYLYKLMGSGSCETVCPIEQTITNQSTHKCDPCVSPCQKCENTTSSCLTCLTGYYMDNSSICQSLCQVGQFYSQGQCVPCASPCLTCQNSSSRCTSCPLDGDDKSFLLITSCLPNCPDYYYEETNGGTLNQCLRCDSNCLKCKSTATTCTQCDVLLFLFQSTCIQQCPDGSQTPETGNVCVVEDTSSKKKTKLKLYLAIGISVGVLIVITIIAIILYRRSEEESKKVHDHTNLMNSQERPLKTKKGDMRRVNTEGTLQSEEHLKNMGQSLNKKELFEMQGHLDIEDIE